MSKIKILVVCGSGVATSMHAAYKMREYFNREKLPVIIDGAGINELAGRAPNYDIVVSNAMVPMELTKPVFSAIPLLTGIGEKELMAKLVETVRELMKTRDASA